MRQKNFSPPSPSMFSLQIESLQSAGSGQGTRSSGALSAAPPSVSFGLALLVPFSMFAKGATGADSTACTTSSRVGESRTCSRARGAELKKSQPERLRQMEVPLWSRCRHRYNSNCAQVFFRRRFSFDWVRRQCQPF